MQTTTTITIDWIRALAQAHGARLRPGTGAPARVHGDHGEGVISAAIAVLIMASLGAAMWVGFQKMWDTTSKSTNTKVEQIGNE